MQADETSFLIVINTKNKTEPRTEPCATSLNHPVLLEKQLGLKKWWSWGNIG